MYQRFVCFKFKADTPTAAVQQHMNMFAALASTIPQIVSYTAGETFPGGESAEQYNTAHYVTYNSQEDINTYFHHPAHQEFILANKEHWEDVLVVDSKIIPVLAIR